MNTFTINLCRFQHKFQNASTHFFRYLIYLSTPMPNLLRFITQLIVYSMYISLPILINYYCQEKSAKAICFPLQNSWRILLPSVFAKMKNLYLSAFSSFYQKCPSKKIRGQRVFLELWLNSDRNSYSKRIHKLDFV